MSCYIVCLIVDANIYCVYI